MQLRRRLIIAVVALVLLYVGFEAYRASPVPITENRSTVPFNYSVAEARDFALRRLAIYGGLPGNAELQSVYSDIRTFVGSGAGSQVLGYNFIWRPRGATSDQDRLMTSVDNEPDNACVVVPAAAASPACTDYWVQYPMHVSFVLRRWPPLWMFVWQIVTRPRARIPEPASVYSTCPDHSESLDAAKRILKSASDFVGKGNLDSDQAVRDEVQRQGGVIVEWPGLELPFGGSARSLGSDDAFVHGDAVAIADAAENGERLVQVRTLARRCRRVGREASCRMIQVWAHYPALDGEPVCKTPSHEQPPVDTLIVGQQPPPVSMLPSDALARANDEWRVRQNFSGSVPDVQVIENRPATTADLTATRPANAQWNRSFTLVRVRTNGAATGTWLSDYFYDSETHRLKYEHVRRTRE